MINPLPDTTIKQQQKRTIKYAGLHELRLHDFRHSFASLLINGGVNIKIISEMMGHSSVDITWNGYRHLYPNAQAKATDYIDSL